MSENKVGLSSPTEIDMLRNREMNQFSQILVAFRKVVVAKLGRLQQGLRELGLGLSPHSSYPLLLIHAADSMQSRI